MSSPNSTELLLELRSLYAGLANTITSLSSSHNRPSKPHQSRESRQRYAQLPLPQQKVSDSLVEQVRRLTELVCIGDNRKAKEERRFDPNYNIGDDGEDEHDDDNDDSSAEVNLFEYFCEKNVLAMLVDLVTGLALSYPLEDATSNDPTSITNRVLVLPPPQIAKQVIQSISILVVSVKSLTSLYYLLSNNYINELIEMDFAMYQDATSFVSSPDKKNNNNNNNNNDASSAEDRAELKTVFINFLKSLAQRIDGQTIQFFMKMVDPPQHHSNNTQEEDDGSVASNENNSMN